MSDPRPVDRRPAGEPRTVPRGAPVPAPPRRRVAATPGAPPGATPAARPAAGPGAPSGADAGNGAQDALGDWHRLHLLSPVARGGRAVAALVIVLAPRELALLAGGGGRGGQVWVDVGILAAALVAGVVAWLVTRWRVAGGELQIETGLLRRRSVRVPMSRVQAVDVVRPWVARLLGLSELRLVLAGRGTGNARLAYLQEDRALVVRAQLLALAHGLARDTPEAPERPLLVVPNGRLIGSVALGAPTAVLLALLALLGVLAGLAPDPAVAVGPLVPALFVAVLLAARRLNLEFDFTVAEAPDGLRLRSGLLQTRAETIPAGRVQAVRWVEPLLWRPLGWCRLEVDVAQQREREQGQADSEQLTRALLPVGSRREAAALLSYVFPGADVEPPPRARPPARARLRAPLSWHLLAAWHTDRYVVARTGRVRPATVVVPLEKVQSLRWVQGPVLRRLRLAGVHADTAGRRWRADALVRDDGEAATLMRDIPGLARQARARESAARAGHRARTATS